MYNNPFLYQNTYSPGLFSRLLGRAAGTGGFLRGGINWGNLLSNTQKSLGIINQAIPIVYQVKPIINNAKTMFRLAGAIKEDDSSSTVKEKDLVESEKIENENKPIFYI